MFVHHSQSFRPVVRFDYGIAAGFQKLARHSAHVLLVLGEQDRFRPPWRLRDRWRCPDALYWLVDLREINLEGSPFSHFAVNPEKSAALLHHSVNRGQAQPPALPSRLGRAKGPTNMRLRFRAHS